MQDKHASPRDGPSTQNRIWQLEEQSELVRAWQPTLVPGQLQTWDYTCAVIEGEPPPDHPWTVRRLARVDLLNDEHRRYELVMSEAALRWVVGSRQIMRAQMEHLIELSHRPNLDIAVVPFGQTILPPPEASFHLFGERSPRRPRTSAPHSPTTAPTWTDSPHCTAD